MEARIFEPAERRLIEVWDYTVAKWGEEQADAYFRELIEAIHRLDTERYRWRPVSHKTLRGVWFVRHRHHHVFFRELSTGGIGVISVLQEQMDLPARLNEDHGKAKPLDD